MPKIELGDLAKVSGITATSSDMAWLNKMDGIVKNILELANLVKLEKEKPIGDSARTLEAVKLPKNQALDYVTALCDHLIKGGYGEVKVGDVLKEIPLTVNQLHQLLGSQALIKAKKVGKNVG